MKQNEEIKDLNRLIQNDLKKNPNPKRAKSKASTKDDSNKNFDVQSDEYKSEIPILRQTQMPFIAEGPVTDEEIKFILNQDAKIYDYTILSNKSQMVF